MERSYVDVKIGAPPFKSATLRDVADRAGVSVATASRVVSGSAAVRPATRDRVERAIRDLLYVPPGRVEPSGAIGLLVPEFGNPVFAALAQAMETRATAAGFATILCNTAGSAMREVDYVHMLLERRVEGMVFICSEITDVRGEHLALREAPRAGRAARVRQRRLRVVAGHLGRRRRAGVGPDRDRAPARARPPQDRVRRRRRLRSRRRARRRAAARTRSPPPASTRPLSPSTTASRSRAAGGRFARCSTRPTATGRRA